MDSEVKNIEQLHESAVLNSCEEEGRAAHIGKQWEGGECGLQSPSGIVRSHCVGAVCSVLAVLT